MAGNWEGELIKWIAGPDEQVTQQRGRRPLTGHWKSHGGGCQSPGKKPCAAQDRAV